jgi:Regulator of polyketide synthase expression
MSTKRKITLKKLAELMNIHRNTLRYYLKAHGVFTKFSSLSNSDLDILVKTFRATKPHSGIRYLVGFLRRHGLRIQKRRVTSSIHRVDGLGQVLHRRTTIRRRKYEVTRPNYLWHVDGHHKLILWGIVIHGMVDGFCRTVYMFNHMLAST